MRLDGKVGPVTLFGFAAASNTMYDSLGTQFVAKSKRQTVAYASMARIIYEYSVA